MIHALHLIGSITFVVFNLEQRMACSPFQSGFIGRLPRPLIYMLSLAAFRRQWQSGCHRDHLAAKTENIH